MEDELLAAFGQDLDVELVQGSGGVYEVIVDGEIVFSKKKEGRFPEPGEIIALVRQ
ncbi:MAG TPA: SelT/SelW/SelH family protein [Desulfobulbaceae bacterium]|nr:SelT/SelW/SelH family protein [Desulfobulbaceae bacterium]